jgi:mannose-6-phosphate isomerase-like protein (cupin superfamily)
LRNPFDILPLQVLHLPAAPDSGGVSRIRKLGPYEIETLIEPAEEGAMTAYRIRIEANQRTGVSYHKVAEEIYIVTRGAAIALINGVERRLSRGDFLRLPPGTTHAFITGDEPIELIDIHSPGSRPDRDVYFVGATPDGFMKLADETRGD